MMSLKDRFYRLLRGRHLAMWKNFLKIPKSQIRICLFVVHHGNKASKDEIIEALSDPQNPLTVKRNIYRALLDGVLVENRFDGTLSVKNPIHFVIKITRGNVLDNWRAVSLLTTFLALYFNAHDSFLSGVFMVLTFALIISWFIDEYLHETHW